MEPAPSLFPPAIRLVSAVFALWTISAHAELLVYEGYDYSTGSISGKSPNNSTVGFDKATPYAGASVANYTVGADSINFGSNFLTSGGSVSSTGTSVLAGKLDLVANSYSGTLWASHLVTITGTRGTQSSDGIEMRAAADVGITLLRFRMDGDTRAGASNQNMSLSYDDTLTAATNANGSAVLAQNTTYLIIGRFTNVGLTLGAGTTGVGTLWALNLAQYENFRANGADEAYLNAATAGSAATQVTSLVSDSASTGNFSFADGNYAHFVVANANSTFDEMRWASTLADVTPVPEPTTLGLLVGSFALAASRRPPRRCRS